MVYWDLISHGRQSCGKSLYIYLGLGKRKLKNFKFICTPISLLASIAYYKGECQMLLTCCIKIFKIIISLRCYKLILKKATSAGIDKWQLGIIHKGRKGLTLAIRVITSTLSSSYWFVLHTLLSSCPLAWTVTRPEQQTRADELDNPALFMNISK